MKTLKDLFNGVIHWTMTGKESDTYNVITLIPRYINDWQTVGTSTTVDPYTVRILKKES